MFTPQVTISLLVVYVRRRYFQRHLHWIVESEFERTKTRDILRAAQGTNTSKRNVQFKPSMIRRVNTLPKPISSSMVMNTTMLALSSSNPTAFEQNIVGQTFGRSDQVQVQQHTDLAPHRGALHSSLIYQTNPGSVDAPLELTRHTTIEIIDPNHSQDDEFGGFGNILDLFASLFRDFFPNMQKKLKRSMTMPIESKLVPECTDTDLPGTRSVSYFSFNVKVRKNSAFYGLSDRDCEELGGVEYRALTALLWIVPAVSETFSVCVHVDLSNFFRVIVRRWYSWDCICSHRTIHVTCKMEEQFPATSATSRDQSSVVSIAHDIDSLLLMLIFRYSIFEVIGAWANTGMSLVDQSLIPFQTAYPMLIFLIWVVIAGNPGYVRRLHF